MPFDHEPKVRILIVEDEVIIADDLEGRLGQLGYFVCGKAVTSEEALELAARRKPDLVVMDIVLKGNTDGIDAAGFIRDTLGIPIVYMTSYADTGHLEKAKPTYPFGYLLKPFQDRDLKITLEMALYAARLDAERSRAEKALHDSRRFLNSTGRMAKVGGWEFDPQSETIKWTEETHRIYGVALDHVPSLAESMDAFHPDEREKIAGAFIRALESGEPYDLEVRFINARGEHLWTRTICRPETVDGRVVMLRGTFQDVTGRKRTEEALRQSEEKYRLATEATTDGLWDWNIITGDVYYSPAWNRMLGLDQDEQNYQAWESRIHPDERSALLEGLQAHLDGQTEQWSREHRLQTAGGNWKWVLGRGRVVERDADGRPGRMVGTMTDISERKQAEMALATRNRELEALHRISGIALSDQPLSAMLEVIAREVAAAVGFPIVSIEYYDETRQEMEFAASTVIPGPVKDMALRVPVTQTLSGVVIRTGRPLVETRAMDRPEYASEALRSLKVRTFVCLPMLAGSRVIGALSLASPSAVLLDEHILPLSASLANLIAGIIHRKRAEDALLESESTYRLLFDGSNDALFIHGLNEDGLPGRFWDVNQVACKRLGYTREELLSLSPLDIGAHGLEETVRTRGRQLLENGRAVFETVHVAKDGRRIPVESSASVFEYKGRPAILSIARYISDRKRAEEAVQESEKRLRLTFNTHPDAISINRMEDGRYLEVNEGFCRLSGYTPEETVGKSSLEINIWHDPADRERLISILREKGSCDNLEFQFRMKDGSLTAGLMSARIISLRGVPCSLSITRNISEQKRAEAERENLQKQLLQAQKME
ncbi:MAG: PAS domain S-box protein, partial [Proteobacteria bacterium]|nr:PAS domain S-box protein [Pseudomonadota bacterium]